MGEAFHIKKCLQLIEARLNWGPGQNWANYDFEKLSSAIEDKTHVVLSITTLKRIWGKVKYDHSPTLTTLNALARFLDYEDWRSFTKSLNVKEEQSPKNENEKIIEAKATRQKKKFKIAIPVYLGLIFLLFLISFMIFSAKKDSVLPKQSNTHYQFKADKVISEGVPNSVVFTYDASSANTDSIFIVQTWDITRKTLVSRENNKHSAIYYYPGFFRTKLIADGNIVKTHDLQITSDGWLCLAEKQPIPLYFKKEEYVKKDRVEIDKDVLKKYNLSLNPDPPRIRFFNQNDLGDLMNDNFVFETTLKNEFSGESNPCQYIEVLIQCKDDIIIIPLSAKACVGDLLLYFAGKQVTSKEADLSKFGCDLNQWTNLKVESKNRNVRIYVNNQQAYSLTFDHQPTGIVGFQYRFNGIGAIKNTKIADEKKTFNF